MQEPESLFTGLVENTGKNAAKVLKEMAQASHERGENNAFTTAHSPRTGAVSDAAGDASSRRRTTSSCSGELVGADASLGLAMSAANTHLNITYEGSSSDYFGVPGPIHIRCALCLSVSLSLIRCVRVGNRQSTASRQRISEFLGVIFSD